MSSKLRKSVNEKVQEIQEQREVLVAILDQFISESLTVAERLTAVSDNALFMQNYVDVMQDLNQCYSICVFLTAEVEERIECFYKTHHGQNLQSEPKAPLLGCSAALKVDLPSDKCDSDAVKDLSVPSPSETSLQSIGKTQEVVNVSKVMDVSDVNKSKCLYDKTVSAECKAKEIDAISIVSDTRECKSGKTTLSVVDQSGVTSLHNIDKSDITCDNINLQDSIVAVDIKQEKSNFFGSLKEETNCMHLEKDEHSNDLVKDGCANVRLQCSETDYNINAAGSEKLEKHKVVTSISPLESEDKADNINVQPIAKSEIIENRGREYSMSKASTEKYHAAVGKPKLDIEVAQRFLSSIIRQAEKDQKAMNSQMSEITENVRAKDVALSPDLNIGPDANIDEANNESSNREVGRPLQPNPEHTFRHIESVQRIDQVHSDHAQANLHDTKECKRTTPREMFHKIIETSVEEKNEPNLVENISESMKGEITQIMDGSLDSAYHTNEGQITDKSEALSITNVNKVNVKRSDDEKGTVSEVSCDTAEVVQRIDGDSLKGTVSEVPTETDKARQKNDDKESSSTKKMERKESKQKRTKPPVKEKPKITGSELLKSSDGNKKDIEVKSKQSGGNSASSSMSSENCMGKIPDTCAREKALISPLLREQGNVISQAGSKEESVKKKNSNQGSTEAKINSTASSREEKSKDKGKEIGTSGKVEKQEPKETKEDHKKLDPEEKKKSKSAKGNENVKQTEKCESAVVENSYGKGPVLDYVSLSPRRVITAIISEACSPWLFYIQEWSNKLTAMMEEVSKYVSTMMSLEAEIVATQHIKIPVEDMVCLAKYSKDSCYYRAKVTKVITKGTETYVNVTYIDYGNKERRKLTHLWELPARFTELPAQAVPCCLAKVAPNNKYGMWTEADINTFTKITLGQTFNMHPVHVSTEPGMPSFVDLFFNIPQIQIVQGKQVLVPGPNQVSVHSLLVSKGGSKVVEISEQINLVKESLGIKTQKPEHSTDGKSSKDKSDSRSQSRAASEEKEKKVSVGKEDADKGKDVVCKQDCSISSTSRVPRPVSKKEQEKCMSKFDKSEKFVKDIKMPRSSTPIDQKRTLNDLDPSTKKNRGEIAPKKKRDTEVKVSNTVLNITEMKIQNNAKVRDDSLSVSSSESGSVHYPGDKDFHKPEKYEVPANTLEVMMSHVNSPSDFYIHPVSKIWGETLSLMSTGLKKQVDQLSSKKLKKMSKSFTPAVGDLCCAQFTQDNHYYRALITDIQMASPSKHTAGDDADSEHIGKVHLFYIDFGDKEILPRRKVLPLPDEYRDIPGLAIHCSLAYVQPEPLEGGKWTQDAVEKFTKITTFEKSLKMLVMLGDLTYTIDNHPKDVIKMPPVQVVLVDYEARDKKSKSQEMEEICINLELIRLGMASLIKDVNQPQSDSPLTPERLKIWDPMREAFLDNRNSYRIDTDDPGMATMGYKQGLTNICKFYQDGDCWRGEACPYRHVIETPGAVTMDQDLVYGNFDELTQDDLLPDPGTWVACEVATILSPNHFYILLPWGKKPLEVLEKEKENRNDEETPHEETLEDLMNSMSEFYDGSKYDGTLLHYAPGEMVAAPFSGDSQWYRARVVDSSESNVKVFYVDFGNKEWVPEQTLRNLEPQFLHLPFQAMECFLADILPTNGQENFSAEAKKLFREMVDGITLVAFIRARSLAGCLYIELYDTRGDSDVSVGQSLILMGLAEEGRDHTPSSSSVGQFSRASSQSSSRESLILIPG